MDGTVKFVGIESFYSRPFFILPSNTNDIYLIDVFLSKAVWITQCNPLVHTHRPKYGRSVESANPILFFGRSFSQRKQQKSESYCRQIRFFDCYNCARIKIQSNLRILHISGKNHYLFLPRPTANEKNNIQRKGQPSCKRLDDFTHDFCPQFKCQNTRTFTVIQITWHGQFYFQIKAKQSDAMQNTVSINLSASHRIAHENVSALSLSLCLCLCLRLCVCLCIVFCMKFGEYSIRQRLGRWWWW